MTESTELTAIAGRTEADAVADITARSAVLPIPLNADDVIGVAVPPGYRYDVVDLEQYGGAPRRVTGSVTVVDAESFATYYGKHRTTPASTMYADVTRQIVVGVLNDAADADTPGWRDHQVTLKLARTPEWQRWAALDGKLVTQTQFAEHIEDSTPEIVEPDAATLLEIAQTFHAHTNVTFESARRLRDGQTQLHYREDTTATAGSKGDIEVPSVIRLSIAPFEVGEVYELVARLRYRIGGGNLQIGYKLDRPDDVLRQAFADVVRDVQNYTGETVLYGTPTA